MSSATFPDVYVKAVAITRGRSILTLFNESWGGFTLPMSRSRTWPHPNDPSKSREEAPHDTAIRAAVEALGRPLGPHELPERHPVHTLDPFDQSGRDGVWKCYHYEIFHMELAPDEVPKPLGGAAVAWMTLEEMETLKPVTSTALFIASAIRGAGKS